MPRKPKAPPHLPMTADEVVAEQEITRKLQQAVVILRQRNLDNAVALAIQAARGQGPLVDHFAEIGRRYGRELSKPTKPKLQVVKGGEA